MAGRAGRKGYYNTGYVSYYPSEYESFDYDIEELYQYLLKAPQESMKITIDISVPDLLRGKSVREEAEYVAKNSIPMLSVSEVQEEIEYMLEQIDEFSETTDIFNFKEILSDIYFPEYSLWTNLNIAKVFGEKEIIEIIDLKDLILSYKENQNEFYSLMQLKKFVRSLPKKYKNKIINKVMIDYLINEIDPTVNDFEQRIINARQV